MFFSLYLHAYTLFKQLLWHMSVLVVVLFICIKLYYINWFIASVFNIHYQISTHFINVIYETVARSVSTMLEASKTCSLGDVIISLQYLLL